MLGVSGQALSPARHLAAIAAHRRRPKSWQLPHRPDARGLVLASAPAPSPEARVDVDVELDFAGVGLSRRGGVLVMTLRSRVGSLGELVPVSLVEPDGLIVTTDGRYVRVIECDRVPNTITADPAQLARVEAAFAHLCQTIGDRQSLMILAQTDPVPIADALAATAKPPGSPPPRTTPPASPTWRERARRLLAATEQTVIAAADAEQPAVAARWWVVVPYRPVIDDPRRQLQALAAGAQAPRPVGRASRRARSESLRYCAQVDGALRRAGIDTWPLDGTQTLALLWERLHPAAETTPDFQRLADACQVAAATDPAVAARVRHGCWRRCARTRPRAWTSAEHPGVDPPRRREPGGDHPSRHPAVGDRPVVAGAPAHLSAARDAGGAHLGRGALPGAVASAAPLAAAARRGALQGPPRPAGRLRRGGRAGGGRHRRRGAGRAARRHRL